MQPREPLLTNQTPPNEQLVLLEHVNNDAVFYSGKQHGKHLDLLLHLSRYSNLLLTITGQQGSGKTHLKNRMLQQLDSGVLVSHIDAKNPLSAAQLLPILSQNLNIEVPPQADFDFYITEIRNFSSLLSEEGGSCLIVIDNAELLEQDALNLILELATTTSDSQRPHVALFGSQELFSKLNQKENLARFESVGHHLPLEAFNEAETRAYLEHRCNSVGIDNLPLNEKQFLNVFKAGKGLPGLLNIALVNELRQVSNQPTLDNSSSEPAKKIKLPAKIIPKSKKTKVAKKAKKSEKPEKSRLPAWPLFGAALLIALVVVGYIYKNSFTSSPSVDTSLISRSHEISKNTLPEPEPIADSEVIPAEIEAPPAVNNEPLADPEPAVVLTPVTTPEAPTPTESLLDLPDDTPTTAQVPAKATVVEPIKKPPPTPPKAVVKAPVKKATWEDQGTRREATLMAKPKDHFTLQMMGSLDEASVKSFIKAQTTDANNFSYFEGRYKGQPWYVVVYGDYSDRDKALAAVQKLPETLQKQRPWARNYLSVQNDIRNR